MFAGQLMRAQTSCALEQKRRRRGARRPMWRQVREPLGRGCRRAVHRRRRRRQRGRLGDDNDDGDVEMPCDIDDDDDDDDDDVSSSTTTRWKNSARRARAPQCGRRFSPVSQSRRTIIPRSQDGGRPRDRRHETNAYKKVNGMTTLDLGRDRACPLRSASSRMLRGTRTAVPTSSSFWPASVDSTRFPTASRTGALAYTTALEPVRYPASKQACPTACCRR